jgi:hypothetical protein
VLEPSPSLPPSELLARLEPLEPARLGGGERRWLFRGDAGPEPRLAPPLAELRAADEVLARAAHALCRRCKDVAVHVVELAHDPLEALALLARHGWPTPLVQLTGSARAALAAATAGAGGPGVVSVVDRLALPARLTACDESLLAALDGGPDREGGPGLALTDVGWRRFEVATRLDLLSPDCLGAVTLHAVAGGSAASSAERGRDAGDVARLRRDLRRALALVGRRTLGPGADEVLARLLAHT